MENIAIILTCYNRKSKTVNCINKLSKNNAGCNKYFFVVDGGSTDGTVAALQSFEHCEIECRAGLFWSQGMRQGINMAKIKKNFFDYFLLVNDDVDFFDNVISDLIFYSKKKEGACIVGATCNRQNKQTYGGIRYVKDHSIKYKMVDILDRNECDTFNANCVLIPRKAMQLVGNIDAFYQHGLGDFDLGLQIKKTGICIYTLDRYVGICENNSIEGTWQDSSISKWKRIRLKETPKGAPIKYWFHFLNKNFGLKKAIFYSITPYIRILLDRRKT